MKLNAIMETPMNGNNGGSIATTAWITLIAFGLGMIKFFNNVLLADAYVWVTLKAGLAATFVALCAALGTFTFNKLIRPYLEKKIEKFKNKNKPS